MLSNLIFDHDFGPKCISGVFYRFSNLNRHGQNFREGFTMLQMGIKIFKFLQGDQAGRDRDRILILLIELTNFMYLLNLFVIITIRKKYSRTFYSKLCAILNRNLTLTRPLRRKQRVRWFFDVTKVQESSFLKSDLTDPPQIFDAHLLEYTN